MEDAGPSDPMPGVASVENHDSCNRRPVNAAGAEETVIRSKRHSGLYSIAAILLWVGPIYLNLVLAVALLVSSFLASSVALLILASLLLLALIPIDDGSFLGKSVGKFIGKYVPGHFPVTVHIEDAKAFDQSKSYVLASEPHSVFPVGCMSLLSITGLMPLPKTKGLASSAVFYTPFFRHITTWMGLVPATKKNFIKYLQLGYSCIIIPGGVKEIVYMNQDYEVAYLKRRHGFVRVAIETGSPLVPVFCFGQSNAYKWWKPGGDLYIRITSVLRFAPLVFWGAFSSPIPYRKPIDIVVGSPINFKQNPNPSAEEVAEVHAEFVSALEKLVVKYREKVGHPDTELRIL